MILDWFADAVVSVVFQRVIKGKKKETLNKSLFYFRLNISVYIDSYALRSGEADGSFLTLAITLRAMADKASKNNNFFILDPLNN